MGWADGAEDQGRLSSSSRAQGSHPGSRLQKIPSGIRCPGSPSPPAGRSPGPEQPLGRGR